MASYRSFPPATLALSSDLLDIIEHPDIRKCMSSLNPYKQWDSAFGTVFLAQIMKVREEYLN